jgi:hypothetical protein
MANIARGESELTVDGEVYHLVIDYNAFANAEDAADMQIDDLLNALRTQPRIKHLRAILYGALQDRHPGTTIADAGRLMSAGGEELGQAIGKAMEGAFHQARASENPPTPPRGAGTTSRQTGRQKG